MTDEIRLKIIKSYTEDKLSLTQCSRMYGTSTDTVWRILKKAGVQLRDRHQAMLMRNAV